MSEHPVGKVSGIRPVEPSAVAAQLYQVYQTYLDRLSSQIHRGNEASNQQQMDGKMQAPTLDPSSLDHETAGKVSKIAPDLGVSTILRFQVDPETNKVTVMVVDKASKKVIATIPPEAIKDIPTGELLQFSA